MIELGLVNPIEVRRSARRSEDKGDILADVNLIELFQ